MSATALAPAHGPIVRVSWAGIVVGTMGLAALAGPLAAVAGTKALAGLVAVLALPLIALRPQLGAYLYLIATPLIVGIGRDSLIPIVRPNEALLLLIVAALGARILMLHLAGIRTRFDFDRIDVALLALATTSSVLPLLLRYGRGLPISADDIFYALVLLKYYLVYRVFRASISTPADVSTCLRLILLTSATVALIAMLQVLGLFGVAEFLWAYYDRPFTGAGGVVTERGTSTLASSFGLADIMAMSLAIALAWLPAEPGRRKPLLWIAAGLFMLGTIAAGQFSGVIGLGVALITVGLVTGRVRRMAGVTIPIVLAASVLFWSVIDARLSGFESAAGLPASWIGRIDNLQRFVWPELSSGVNWLVGVRPAARMPAPEFWREWVFIESGYVWLLWTGGLPLVAAFIYFTKVAFGALLRRARAYAADPVGVAATAARTGLLVIVVLMLLDPHLTMRGSADLFFPLLALAFAAGGRTSDRRAVEQEFKS